MVIDCKFLMAHTMKPRREKFIIDMVKINYQCRADMQTILYPLELRLHLP